MIRLPRSARSLAERVPLPRPLPWAVATAVLMAAVAYVVVRPVPLSVGPLDVTIAVVAALALGGLLTARRCGFALLARRPGPVEIIHFDGPDTPAGPDRGRDGSTAPVIDTLADFRSALIRMSLSIPQSIPNAASRDSMLDGVREAVKEPPNAVATIVAVVREVVDVRYAYQVSAQMRHGTGPSPCGITLHIGLRPSGAGDMRTVWAETWPDAAERAAHVVGAFLLPRSRLTRRPPWRAWRGLAMPNELFHQVQLADRYIHQRRYEEACAALHAALALDTQNPYLRIQLAQTQEQLGLHLDALAVYYDVVAIESWYDRRLWMRLRKAGKDRSLPAPQRFLRSPHGPHALMIARYRLISSLVSVHENSSQWQRGARSDPDHDGRNPRRSRERTALRTRLLTTLQPYIGEYAEAHGVEEKEVHAFVDADREDGRRLIRHVLRFIGCREIDHLTRDYRWRSGRRRPGMPVTQTALSVLQTWAPIQLCSTQVRIERTEPPVELPPGHRFAEDPAARAGELQRHVERSLRSKPRRLREWQESYNAACTFAVAMRVTRDPDEIELFTRLAVHHLEDAVSSADSGHVGAYSHWLTTGDDDLKHLRRKPQFTEFLDRYMPEQDARIARPPDLFRLMISLHCVRLLRDFAGLRAAFWGTARDRSAGSVAEELAREQTVRDVALTMANNERHWESRYALVREARRFARRHGLAEFDSTFPTFSQEPSVRGFAVRLEADGSADPTAFFDDVVRQRDEAWPDLLHVMRRAGAEPGDSPRDCHRYWASVRDHLDRTHWDQWVQDHVPHPRRRGSPVLLLGLIDAGRAAGARLSRGQ